MNAGLLELGQTVAGKYLIERTLGQGGMGVVYVATHRLTGKRLALKCLLPEFVNNADIVGRFMREAQAAGRVQHRNVVDVFDVGRDGATCLFGCSLEGAHILQPHTQYGVGVLGHRLRPQRPYVSQLAVTA